MKIIDKTKFILGIIDVLVGICLIFVGMILSNIVTRAKRQKRKEELTQMFKDNCGNCSCSEDTSDTSLDNELKD